ncbi:uncharacterized protein LOC108106318 isoform X2 [Drosophila eugracilis]|uniref:uncharacterized protein LOC108106318 isoform X2 n=1 Tax=Drosophila eugracilis TaxID=29029 RepID=UPI0007E789FB|nr:uncharacterized protein LOC108106318 isoform X2 [Drosophila eugracilis]
MLKRCCFCIKLRKACIIIAVLDFLINVVVLNLSGQEFVAHIEQAVAICHCIGCTFLLGGALIPDQLLNHDCVLHLPAGERRTIPGGSCPCIGYIYLHCYILLARRLLVLCPSEKSSRSQRSLITST